MIRGKRTIWRFATVATCVLCAWMALPTRAQSSDPSNSSEYLIKAGFVYNFAKLTDWPAPAFSQPNSPIVIGIVGEADPFRGTLDDVLRGKQANGRDFVVKHLRWKDDLKGCNILFISASARPHLADILHAIHGLPILTMGDTPGFAEQGGIINFVLDDNRVRFDIDVEAAKQANLNISSRVLALARIVPEAGSDGRKSP